MVFGRSKTVVKHLLAESVATPPRRRAADALAIGGVSATLLLLGATGAAAHTPHVEVFGLAASGLLGKGGFLYTVVREGLWRTGDGGNCWQHLWRGLPHARVRAVAVVSPSDLVAGTDAGLFRSRDHGESWTSSLMPAGAWPLHNALGQPVPRPRLSVVAGLDGRTLRCLANGQIFESTDMGARWRRILEPPGPEARAVVHWASRWWTGYANGTVACGAGSDDLQLGAPVTAFAVERQTGVLYVATDGAGVWNVAADGTLSITGLAGERVTSLTIVAASDGETVRLAAATWHKGVYFREAGRWVLRARGLTRDPQASTEGFRVPHFGQLTVAKMGNGNAALFLGGFDGLFRWSAAERRWHSVVTGVTPRIVVGLTALRKGAAVSLYGGGLTAADDGGQSWNALRGVRTFAIARAPCPDGVEEIWVAAHDFVHVVNGGGRIVRNVTLREGAEGASSGGVKALRRLILHPAKVAVASMPPPLRDAVRGLVRANIGRTGLGISVAAFGSQFAVPADYGRHGVAFLGTWFHGLFRTEDFGRSFHRLALPGQHEWINDVAVSEWFARDGAVHVATEGGLLRSRDGGATWENDEGLEGPVLRVVAGRDASDHLVILAATWQGLLRRETDCCGRDGSWKVVLSCRNYCAPTEIALAPDFMQSGIGLVSMAGHGLQRTDDWGQTFVPSTSLDGGASPQAGQLAGFPDAAHTISFSADFVGDATVWCAFGETIQISRDGGSSWQRVLAATTALHARGRRCR